MRSEEDNFHKRWENSMDKKKGEDHNNFITPFKFTTTLARLIEDLLNT